MMLLWKQDPKLQLKGRCEFGFPSQIYQPGPTNHDHEPATFLVWVWRGNFLFISLCCQHKLLQPPIWPPEGVLHQLVFLPPVHSLTLEVI